MYTIVNPNSGPGDGEFPNSDYAPAIAKLRSFPNVKTLGYVRTNWAARPLEEITNEVDTYAGWKNYADADVQVVRTLCSPWSLVRLLTAFAQDGIFFDESPTETGAHFDVIKSAADHARTVLATGHDHIVLNPGTPPAPAYFDIADDNTAYEISASSFSVGNISPATANQSSVILYNFQGTEAQLRGNTSAIVNAGVKGLYITAADGYT